MSTSLPLLLLLAAGSSAAPPPVKSPDLAKPIELMLPSAPDDAVLAGNGQYIAFTCPEAKQIAVVDVTAGTIAKTIPFTEEDVRTVGTLSRLFVYTPRARSFQGYKVGKFEEDDKPKFLPATAPNEGIGSLVAAPGVDGLVILQFPKAKLTAGFGIFQPKPGFGALNWSHFGPTNAWGPVELRISHTGTLLVGWGGGYAGLEAAVIRGVRADVWEDQYKYGPVPWAMPSADGQYIYLSAGQLTRTMTFAGGQKKDQPYTFPAVDPGFYLTAPASEALAEGKGDRPVTRNSHGSGAMREVTLYTADNQQVVSVKADVLNVKMDLPPEKRVFFYNAASMLVRVGGPKKTTVKLERLSLKDELDKAGGDYLVVASAPTTATRNNKFTYPLTVLSKKGGVTAKLDRGPAGMKVSGTTLTWDVPFGFKDRYASFQVSVSDASGKTVLHLGQLVILNP
ncbi:hypothetical protein [Limnoglobus roseus]|uniref:Serine protease n=1 Tax=Limnoglobus roseus TaxID=2598579 RepID=A0A5C1AB14_9BACT|nr:hypothetical protein [Limnoglobus roseus]QEL14218.1 serine protease [Limnoglobus roseus]